MKYIKTYENRRKPCEDCKFQPEDYVKFIEDYINGAPVKDISKEIFQIEKSSKDGLNQYTNKNKNMYLLKYLNGESFVWVYEDAIKLAPPEEVEFYIDTKKYNL